MRRRLRLVPVLAALAMAACGSTVSLTSSPGPQSGDGLTAVGGDGLPSQPSERGTRGPVAGGPGPSKNVGDGAGGSPVRGSGTTTGPSGSTGSNGISGAPGRNGPSPGGPTRRGLSASSLTIGVVTSQDAATLGKSLGAESLVGGDHVAEVDALVKHINARGGVSGRKLSVVYQDVKTSDATTNPSSSAQVGLRRPHRG